MLEKATSDTKHLEQVANHATQLAKNIADEAKDRAEKVVRYKQRLAGLRAEMEAEMKIQLKEVREEWSPEDAVKGGFLPDSVGAGFHYADQYLCIPGLRLGIETRLTVRDIQEQYKREEAGRRPEGDAS
jgi:hypothetical protein